MELQFWFYKYWRCVFLKGGIMCHRFYIYIYNLCWSTCWTFSQYFKLWFITERKTNVHFSYLQGTTMIRRWSKPKSFSGGGTPRRRDDPDGQISRCTILDVDVSHIRFVALRVMKPPNPKIKCWCLVSFGRWIGARRHRRGGRMERKRVEYRSWDPGNWTVLAWLPSGFWRHHFLPCAQGCLQISESSLPLIDFP